MSAFALVGGMAISPLPAPFLALSSTALASAYVGHAALTGRPMLSTLVDVVVMVTAHQIGFLLGTAMPMLRLRFDRSQLLWNAKLLALALVLAAGAFVLTMMKDPPRSIASDPALNPAPKTDTHLPAGLPTP